jgi:hypothetical protein
MYTHVNIPHCMQGINYMKTWAMRKETYKGTIKKINNDNSHTKSLKYKIRILPYHKLIIQHYNSRKYILHVSKSISSLIKTTA